MRTHRTIGISFSPELEAAARARAAALGLSFSTYVQQIVEQDVRKGGPMIVREVSAEELSDLGLDVATVEATRRAVLQARTTQYRQKARSKKGSPEDIATASKETASSA